MINLYDEFCQLVGLDSDLMKERRRFGKIYGNFIIAYPETCEWLKNLEGIEFMAEIVWCKNAEGKRKVKEVIPVRVTSSFVVRGRAITGEAVILL